MGVYKDKAKNTWFVKTRYKDWKNETRWLVKRGFATKREATQYEEEFKVKLSGTIDMKFSDFVNVYRQELWPRIRPGTAAMKDNIINTKILPYFSQKSLREISASDIIRWQNHLLQYKDPQTGNSYSKTYLRTVHSQMSAIFNHAVRYYRLPENPAKEAGSIGSKKNPEMKFWSKEEYLRFRDAIMENPFAFYCFEMLYWCGIREGELLALTEEDFDFDKKTVRINKSYQKIKGQEIIGPPKTEKSNRTVVMPDFLADEVQEYLSTIYPKDRGRGKRLFCTNKSFLLWQMKKYSRIAGVPCIRIHDLRHSHVSLLIHMGYSALAIADRVGHESIDITYRYAHLFPTVQNEMANDLNNQLKEDARNV